MTNAEKFLKDGVDIKQFAEMIDTAYVKADSNADVCESTINWLNKQVKPTLTEDERTILRNIDKNRKYTMIKRDEDIDLMLSYDDEKKLRTFYTSFDMYNHLFQFIKSGEEYSIEELLKGE